MILCHGLASHVGLEAMGVSIMICLRDTGRSIVVIQVQNFQTEKTIEIHPVGPTEVYVKV